MHSIAVLLAAMRTPGDLCGRGRGSTCDVEMSHRFDDDDGSLSMRARLAQLVLHSHRAARRPRVLGRGLILKQPLTRAMFRDFRG